MTRKAGDDGSDALRDLVEVMDTLRSPGGCPWDARQTHESLASYALEEAYEVAEAIELGDRAGMREELGDLLLQVVFHARVAQEHEEDPFDLDDIADGLVAKLVRRHPHVFGPDEVLDAETVHERWEQIKKTEKRRESVLDGIPLAQGALARAQKVIARVRRAGLSDSVGFASSDGPARAVSSDLDKGLSSPERDLGNRLLDLVLQADAAGIDAESALRATVRTVEESARKAERR
jgi:XTP/dITP diphosphohydrolase